MTSGINRKEKWFASVRYREADDAGTKGITEDVIFYDWKLSFCDANTEKVMKEKISETIKFLTSTGRIIGGIGDPITIEHIVTNTHTRTLAEFEEEVKSDNE